MKRDADAAITALMKPMKREDVTDLIAFRRLKKVTNAQGQSRTFTWKVTPVRSGTYSVRYRVAAGLYGKAQVVDTTTGTVPKGSFIARVSHQPRPVQPTVEDQRAGAA